MTILNSVCSSVPLLEFLRNSREKESVDPDASTSWLRYLDQVERELTKTSTIAEEIEHSPQSLRYSSPEEEERLQLDSNSKAISGNEDDDERIEEEDNFYSMNWTIEQEEAEEGLLLDSEVNVKSEIEQELIEDESYFTSNWTIEEEKHKKGTNNGVEQELLEDECYFTGNWTIEEEQTQQERKEKKLSYHGQGLLKSLLHSQFIKSEDASEIVDKFLRYIPSLSSSSAPPPPPPPPPPQPPIQLLRPQSKNKTESKTERKMIDRSELFEAIRSKKQLLKSDDDHVAGKKYNKKTSKKNERPFPGGQQLLDALKVRRRLIADDSDDNDDESSRSRPTSCSSTSSSNDHDHFADDINHKNSEHNCTTSPSFLSFSSSSSLSTPGTEFSRISSMIPAPTPTKTLDVNVNVDTDDDNSDWS